MVTKPTNKIDDEIQLIAVTQKQMARALGLGTTRINQLIDEGIIVRDETSRSGQVMLFESLRNFFLSKNANLGDGENSVNFWRERGLHEKAKRELAEVKLSKTRGELYDASTVEAVMSELLTNFRSKLLGLPAKLTAQLEGKSRAEIYSALTVAVEENLTELASGLEGANFENGADVEADVGEVNPPDT